MSEKLLGVTWEVWAAGTFGFAAGALLFYLAYVAARASVQRRSRERAPERGTTFYNLVTVFGAFAFASLVPIKEMGFGLAVAVFLDATIIRIVMVPASMRLMGRWNWWLPRWLD